MVEQYRCPVCGIDDQYAYTSCNHPACTDGRDPRPSDRLEALERENAEQKDNLTFWKGVAASNAEWADKERVAREAAERRNAELEADNLRLQNEWDNCDEMLQATRADKARLSEALTPSGATKAAYLGDFYERIEVANPNHEDDEDEPETLIRQVPVSWTTIKEIMAAISARAALAGSGGGWPVPEDMVLVPVSALKWLNGEGPDANGHWFGDAPDDCKRGAFWWRTKFTAMITAAHEEAKEARDDA